MTMGEYLSKMGKTQLRIAETQKYAHVTFFFNGGEERVSSPARTASSSRRRPPEEVPTFDLKPEMSAYEVTDAVHASASTRRSTTSSSSTSPTATWWATRA